MARHTNPPGSDQPISQSLLWLQINLISRSTLLDTLSGYEVAFCAGPNTFESTRGDLSGDGRWTGAAAKT